MRRLQLSIVGGIMLGLMSGCVLGPNFQEPKLDVPPSYRHLDGMPADARAELQWWELFQDPVLKELVQTALRENKDVAMAAARIEQARALLTMTGADRFPHLDLTGSLSRGNPSGIGSVDSSALLGASAGWEIDFWGKFRRLTESARAELLASEAGLRSVQVSLVANVVSSYFQLLDYKQRLAIARKTLDSRDAGLKIIRQRLARGLIPQLDLDQATIQREIAAAAVPLYESLVARTEHALSVLLGRLPATLETGAGIHDQLAPPRVPVGLPASLLRRRPDIIQARYLLMAQNARIGAAVAQRFPSFSLTGMLGMASGTLAGITRNGTAWQAGGGLLGPILDFNKSKARVELERARTREALHRYENTVLRAFQDVEDALVEVHALKRELAAARRQFAAASNAEALSRQRYTHGVTSYLELLEAQRSAFDAELQLSAAKQAYLNAYVRLYKALGGGWITPAEADRVSHEAVPGPAGEVVSHDAR